MSMPVPRSASPKSVFALAAVLCLMAAAAAPTTAALAQTPDPAPLWKAYPLTPGKATGAKPAEHPNGAPLIVDETRPPRADANSGAAARTAVPLGVAIAFYFALGILSAIGVGAATLYVVRRRAQPVTCEISWSPGEQGAAFLATAQRGGQEEWVVARSGRFDRSAAEPPEYDTASHAYDQLLSDLYADGWLPYERGREWWAMRLRRPNAPETSTRSRNG
jgi:hypothetical protein